MNEIREYITQFVHRIHFIHSKWSERINHANYGDLQQALACSMLEVGRVRAHCHKTGYTDQYVWDIAALETQAMHAYLLHHGSVIYATINLFTHSFIHCFYLHSAYVVPQTRNATEYQSRAQVRVRAIRNFWADDGRLRLCRCTSLNIIFIWKAKASRFIECIQVERYSRN